MTQRLTRGGGSDFGGELRRYRESAGLSQEELAERAGLTAKGISALERGERRNPYPQTVRALADALNLSDADRSALIAVVPRRGRSERGDLQRVLLETKLHAPALKQRRVSRPRLTAMLDRTMASRLTLVSAPPGFGKSTLVADWLLAPDRTGTAAWLSLDAGDNDPATFWSYVVAALRTADPAFGSNHPDESSGGSAPGVAARWLVNELLQLPGDIVLVLDDYHVVDAEEVHRDLEFLIDHLPANAHVVITTRADPALPLARLRAGGELVEIRAADLRFTADEAATYLRDIMGLPIGAAGIAVLEARTEGWIAALQLAALSMQGRDDLDGFIAGFAGDDRYIVDYLADEVLRRQPVDVRSFLISTSILSRMNWALVNAVTGRTDGKATLESLDRANLFVIPLDDRRDWFRYHHLFAEVLRAHLRDEEPAAVSGLHEVASGWFEEHGDLGEALGHAVAAGRFERAADLIEQWFPELRRTRQETTMRRAIEALPSPLVRMRPVLAIGYVGALMSTGTFEGVEELLRSGEEWLERGSASGMVVRNEAEGRALPAAIAMYRAAIARDRGDAAGAMAQARRALDLVTEDDHVGRGGAEALLGLTYWSLGDLGAAYRWFADGMGSLGRAGFAADVAGGALTLGGIRLAEGRLTEALAIYERGLALAVQPAGPALRGAANLHVGISEILFERNDLDGARRHLDAAAQLGDESGTMQVRHRSRVAAARVLEAEGRSDAAVELLGEAERNYFSDFAPSIRPIGAIRAGMWIAGGKLALAEAWVRDQGLAPTDELTYLREYEHMVLARLLATDSDRAGERLAAALGLLGRLLEAAESGGRWRSVIEVLVLQALGLERAGEPQAATACLARALTLAEPEGYVRVFVTEGQPMARLLKRHAKSVHEPYVRSLLAQFDGHPAPRESQVEPLSERELDVMRLLATDLSGPDIARQLFVSLNTLRTHTKSIYSKLGVSSRHAAVRAAGELNVLGDAHR